MRALVDASVLLRFPPPSPNPARSVDLIVSAALAGAFELLLPSELLTEITGPLATYPYIVARAIPRQVEKPLVLLAETATLLPPNPIPFPPLTRDPAADYLLAYALRDRADSLVTGGRDLLVVAPAFERPRIIDAGAFVRHLRDRGLLDP